MVFVNGLEIDVDKWIFDAQNTLTEHTDLKTHYGMLMEVTGNDT